MSKTPFSKAFVQLSNTRVRWKDSPRLVSPHNLLGQKCSALSRLYVSSSVWNAGGFKDKLLEKVAGIKIGSPTKFDNFMGPVMWVCSSGCLGGRFDQIFPSNKTAFDKILGYIEKAKAAGGQVLIGGAGQHFSPICTWRAIELAFRR